MDYNKKILQFFTNELDSEHRNELKVEMASDANLSEDMKLQQEVLYTIANQEDDLSDFRQQLNSIAEDFMEEEESVKKSSFSINYWLAAASVIVVVGLGSYLGLLSGSAYTGDQVFVEYYSPYGTDMTIRGGEQTSSFDNALERYQSGDMNAALAAFNELAIENEELAGFFTGLCYLEMGNTEDAKQQFIKTEKTAVFYEEQVKWYLALCHLKLEEYDQAELLLTQLMTGGNKYSKEAEEVLEKLGS